MAAIVAAPLIFKSSAKAGGTNAFISQVATNGLSKTSLIWRIENKAYQGQEDTNGLACKIDFSGFPLSPGQAPPVCVVYVTNTTTNIFRNYWRSFPTNYLNVDLLDSSGKVVKKTAAGEKYTASISDPELEKIYHSIRNWRSGSVRIHSSDTQFASFGVPDLFEPQAAGEYTLQVHMRLIQVWPQVKTRWLPVVTAKIQIQSIGGSPVNLSPPTKTNSPAK